MDHKNVLSRVLRKACYVRFQNSALGVHAAVVASASLYEMPAASLYAQRLTLRFLAPVFVPSDDSRNGDEPCHGVYILLSSINTAHLPDAPTFSGGFMTDVSGEVVGRHAIVDFSPPNA